MVTSRKMADCAREILPNNLILSEKVFDLAHQLGYIMQDPMTARVPELHFARLAEDWLAVVDRS